MTQEAEIHEGTFDLMLALATMALMHLGRFGEGEGADIILFAEEYRHSTLLLAAFGRLLLGQKKEQVEKFVSRELSKLQDILDT